jgi:hypothetical protein
MNNNNFPASVRFNWGFWDAKADIEHNHENRMCIPQGHIFCLPKWDKAYRDGYAKGCCLDSVR